MTNIVEIRNLTKTFGEVVANNKVRLDLRQGEILALLGENGSGKTTLMNMLSGIYQPDSGDIFINGEKVVIHSPEEAKRLGIGMVHQHFKLIDSLSAADNIWMGAEKKEPFFLKDKFSFVDSLYPYEGLNGNSLRSQKLQRFKVKTKLCLSALNYKLFNLFRNAFLNGSRYNDINDMAKKFGFELDSRKLVCDMAVSEKQTCEIIKVLFYGAKILILDEPTAVLTTQEIQKLFATMRKMKERGCSIIIITHKLNEVLEISDRVAIMRKGEYITTVDTKDANEQILTELMVGEKVELHIDRPKTDFDRPLLEIRDLTVKSDEGSVAIDNMSFYIRGGEMLGVAGISGCGQKELCEAIAGLRRIESGEINHKGQSLIGLPPKKIIEMGISMSFIPEDRLGMGLAPSMSITDNMMLKTYSEGKFNPFVNRKKARERASQLIKELNIVTPSTETPVRRLSGGNVQKVLVGREIESSPNVIITAYPVRGLDINSSYAIYDILNDQKKNGVGILFVGEDLDVMLALCDKIMVICHGKLMGVVHAEKTTKEQLGLMMTGALDLQIKNDKTYGIAKDSNITEEALNDKNE